MAKTKNTPTVVFDISRMISRVGQRYPTGIGRVERAYLEHFLRSNNAVVFLVRFGKQSALLKRDGMRQVYQSINNGDPQGLAQKTVRRTSMSWPFLERGLKALVPDGQDSLS